MSVWIRSEGLDREGIRRTFSRMRRRFRKPLPAAFLVICAIVFLGGALNPISNGDSIGYRIPRVHHWLSEQGWHWIHTGDERMNVVGMNYEWLCGPVLKFLKDDRWLFLVTFSAFVLLPALFFVFLRQVGVRPRVAWWWMWLLPAGIIFAMQASSVATDGFSATPALAAIVFALRAVATRKPGDLLISILAFGFLTGIKQTTLPLAIVWILPAAMATPLLIKRPILAAGCIFIAALASTVPVTVANIHYTGSWKGFKHNYEQPSPVWGVVGNAVILPVQNLQPPLFPWAPKWNATMKRFVQTPAGKRFEHFEVFAELWRAPTEINSGLGFALSVLLIVGGIGMAARDRSAWRMPSAPAHVTWVRWTPLIAIGAFMAKSALSQMARYAAPFYPFLLPLILARRGNSWLVRQRWWQRLAYGAVGLTLFLLATSRQHAPYPAMPIVSRIVQRFPNSGFMRKVQNSYSFSRQNSDWLAKINELIPMSEKRVGYSAEVGMKERTLWQSVPGRVVYDLTVEDTPEYAAKVGVEYVLVEPGAYEATPGKTIASWLERFPGTVLGQIESRPVPDAAPEIAYVVRLKR